MSNCIKDFYYYDLVKECYKCVIVKLKTDFYFRNINQKYRKECAQCTKVKQNEYNSENREKIENNRKQNRAKKISMTKREERVILSLN